MMKYSELKGLVRRRIPEELYRHCVATGQTAHDLAAQHGFDSRKARIAGLLHDIARPLDDGRLVEEAERFGIITSELERAVPVLLHAKVGARIVETELGITDPDIVEAIEAHTTGAPGMSAMARIVFVADYVEPTRDLSGADEVRALLPDRLEEAVLAVVKEKIEYVTQAGRVVDPRCIELLNELGEEPPGRVESS